MSTKAMLGVGCVLLGAAVLALGLGNAAKAVGVDWCGSRRRPALLPPGPADPDRQRMKHPHVSSVAANGGETDAFSPDAFRDELLH